MKQLLLNLGLTKYEVEAYIYVYENGVVEASDISKEANIPYGKIYETLNKLESFGFLEVQYTRPKKYRTKNANLALDEYLQKKRQILDQEYGTYEYLSKQILNEMEEIDQNEKKETVFWRTAIGTEIHDLYLSSLKGAKEEIFFFSPHTQHDLQYIEHEDNYHGHEEETSLNEIFTAIFKQITKENINIKILYSGTHECKYFRDSFLPMFGLNSDIHQLEIKASKKEIVTSPLLLIDNLITIFEIVDPTDNHSTLGITKIWDRKLTLKIKEKLEIIWENGENYSQVFPKTK
jgi:sugar-specific transcriptional regulator TrmB